MLHLKYLLTGLTVLSAPAIIIMGFAYLNYQWPRIFVALISLLLFCCIIGVSYKIGYEFYKGLV